MIFTILVGVLGMIIFAYYFHRNRFDLPIIFSLIIGIFISTLSLGVLAIIHEYNFPYEYVHYDHKIYALEDNNSLDGEFFLGCGSFNSDISYYYIMENDIDDVGKVKKMYSESKDISYIKNTNSTPHVSLYFKKLTHKNRFFRLYKPGKILDNYTYVVFYVPEGTIKNNFNIDLK
jgi:hypothetical protein